MNEGAFTGAIAQKIPGRLELAGIKVRYFSTRSEIFRSKSSRSSCALCRSESLKDWAITEPRRWMSDW